MLQQAMIELPGDPKSLIISKNNTDRFYRILDVIAEIFNFHQPNPKKRPVFDDIREQGSGNTSFYESEETVFATPDQAKQLYNNHRLVVISGNSPDKTYHLHRSKMMIGRDRGSQIRIDDQSVSLYHSMICMKANECILKDLNSKNGTMVNGHRVLDSHKLRNGDKIAIGSTIFTFIHGDLGRSFVTRKHFRNRHFIPGALVFLGVFMMSILISLNHIKAGLSQPASSEGQKESIADSAPGKKDRVPQAEISTAQPETVLGPERPVALEGKGQQLIQRALDHYINGNIALSYKMLEETLQLNLPTDSALRTSALVIKDKIATIYNLYEEGLKQYKATNTRQALEIWSQALITDQDIAGQNGSYFAGQIAIHTGDILYRMAREAMDKGNNEKAQELCSQTFRVQENHEGCMAIMKTISQGSNQ
jgi:hypothetical protein